MYSYFKRTTLNKRGTQTIYYRICKGEILSFNVTNPKVSRIGSITLLPNEIDVLEKDEFDRAYSDFKLKFNF